MTLRLSKKEIESAAEQAGLTLISAIEKLKKVDAKDPSYIPMEFYLIDNDYDVCVRVMLRTKKSQLQHGLEMFKSKLR